MRKESILHFLAVCVSAFARLLSDGHIVTAGRNANAVSTLNQTDLRSFCVIFLIIGTKGQHHQHQYFAVHCSLNIDSSQFIDSCIESNALARDVQHTFQAMR